jgi:hypothetical protein
MDNLEWKWMKWMDRKKIGLIRKKRMGPLFKL